MPRFRVPLRRSRPRLEGHPIYLELLDEIRKLHKTKSSGYGVSKDPFANFTTVANLTNTPRFYYAILRAQEKLARCFSLYQQGRYAELGEEFLDNASLFLCAEAMRREDDSKR